MPKKQNPHKKTGKPKKGMNMTEGTSRITNDRQPHPQQQDTQDSYKVRREWANLVIGVLTLATVVYYAHQAKIQAVANKEAADAAAAGAKAWIGFNGVVSGEVKDTQAVFVVSFINAGKTPALDIATTWEFVFAQGPDESSAPKLITCPTTNKNTPGVMQAGQPWVIQMDEQLSEGKAKMLRDKTAHLYVHGCVTYHDVLTQAERITEFSIVSPAFAGEGFSLDAPNIRMK